MIVTDALRCYLDKQEQMGVFDDFVEGPFSKPLHDINEGVPKENQEIASSLHDVLRSHFFFMRLTNLKVARIAQPLPDLILHENVTVQMVLVRTLVEHTSVATYQRKLVRKIEPELRKKASSQDIIASLADHLRASKSLYFSNSQEGASKHKMLHSNDMIEGFESDYPGVKDIYSKLCNYVHPNFGSNYLLSPDGFLSGRLGQDARRFQSEIDEANEVTIKCLELAESISLDISIELAKLNGFVELASDARHKLSTIFSEKGLSHDGDGKGKASAIWFRKARTHQEAIKMIYRYFKDNSIIVIGSKRIGAIEGGFVYDVFPTSSGNVWFKTRMQ